MLRPTVTLQQLICFKTGSGNIDIMKEIGTHYKEVGVLPLDDTNGEVVESLVEYHHYGIDHF